jgi:HSP20 family protein
MVDNLSLETKSIFGWMDPESLFDFGVISSNAGRPGAKLHVWRPPTDVYETEDAVLVKVEIAGIRENDFSIFIQDRMLTIRGIRMDTPERKAYRQMEIRFGEFSTEIELPSPVVIDQAQAEYRSGFLTVVLPKQKPIQVKITEP